MLHEKYELAAAEMDEANVRYEKMKEEYEPDRRGRLKKLIWLSRQQEHQMNETTVF